MNHTIYNKGIQKNNCSIDVCSYNIFIVLPQEVFQLVLAVQWNGDEMSALNVVGLCICLCGIICHVIHKIKHQPIKSLERHHYMEDLDGHDIGENLINGELYVDVTSASSEDENSDTDILFDILNRHER